MELVYAVLTVYDVYDVYELLLQSYDCLTSPAAWLWTISGMRICVIGSFSDHGVQGGGCREENMKKFLKTLGQVDKFCKTKKSAVLASTQ